MAEFITAHSALKPVDVVGLLFTVTMSTVVVNTSLAEKAATIVLLVLVSVALAVWAVMRRGGGATVYLRVKLHICLFYYLTTQTDSSCDYQ